LWLKASITVDIDSSLAAEMLEEETSLQVAVFVTLKVYAVLWYLAANLLVTFSLTLFPPMQTGLV